MRSLLCTTATRRTILASCLLLSVFVIGCKTIHEEDLFFPRPQVRPPAEANRDDIHILASDGETIGGWNVRVPAPRAQLIYFYGNGETVADSLRRMNWLAESWQVNVLCVDYRGYGFSEGRPSIDALLADALLAYDEVQDASGPTEPVLLYGRSLGTTAALHLAAERPSAGLILEAPFPDVDSVIRAWNRQLPAYLRWIVRLKPEASLRNRSPQPIDLIANYERPVLVIHGSEDEVIPMALGRQMFDAAASPRKTWLDVPGHGHNNLSLNHPAVEAALDDFFNQAANLAADAEAKNSVQ